MSIKGGMMMHICSTWGYYNSKRGRACGSGVKLTVRHRALWFMTLKLLRRLTNYHKHSQKS